MSAIDLPAWQHRPLRWLLNRMLRKKGAALTCEQCETPLPRPSKVSEALWDMVVTCPSCGHFMPLVDAAMAAGKNEEDRMAESVTPVEPPPESDIEIEDHANSRIWRIPRRKGFNFILGFGILWMAVVSLAFAGILATQKSASFPLILFIAIFPLVGLGMIFAGLRMKYSRHQIQIDPVELVHERLFFHWSKRKTFPIESIQKIELAVFYSQNYEPVHGIEISSTRGKIRFGSVLTFHEKLWLCQDLRRAMGWAVVDPAPPSSAGQSNSSSSDSQITVEENARGCVIHVSSGKKAIGLLVAGIGMAAITGFMLLGGLTALMDAPLSAPFPFSLLIVAFMVFWCGGVGTGFILGLGIILAALRMYRTRQKIVANNLAIQVLETVGKSTQETLLEAPAVVDVRLGHAPSANTRSDRESGAKRSRRGLIVLQDRVIGFGSGLEPSTLNTAILALKRALKLR